jgi:hypothetical protein
LRPLSGSAKNSALARALYLAAVWWSAGDFHPEGPGGLKDLRPSPSKPPPKMRTHPQGGALSLGGIQTKRAALLEVGLEGFQGELDQLVAG